MFTSRYLVVIVSFFLLILVVRLLFFYNSKQNSGEISISGQILSEPYLKKGELNFRLDRYKVFSPYQNIRFGDSVAVTGNLDQGVIQANKVEILVEEGLLVWFKRFRLNLNNTIRKNLPEPQSQLLSGILLGIKSDLGKDFKQDLVNTGTLHVVVVSGYNIALVAGLALSLRSLIGRKKASLLAAILVIIYTFLVGISAPTLRATLMALLTIAAAVLGRATIAIYLLCLTGYLMLFFNPANLADISFQLTFLATLGLVLFTKPISGVLKKITKSIREPLATTLAAQSLVTPLIFFYFGTFSLSAPVVNILVLWTIPLATLGGFIYLLLSQVSSLGASLFSYLLLLPLTIFTLIVKIFGKFKFLVFESEKGNFLVLIGYFMLIIATVVFLWTKSYASKDR